MIARITLFNSLLHSGRVYDKLNFKGADKRSLGRGDLSSDVLARTLVGFETYIISVQKNLISQKVLEMLETNHDPNFASTNEQAYVQKVGADGFIQLVEELNSKSNNTFKKQVYCKSHGLYLAITALILYCGC